MSLAEHGRELARPRTVGMSRGEAGGCPRVAVMAFDPGPTR
jgi:hypothetical protein